MSYKSLAIVFIKLIIYPTHVCIIVFLIPILCISFNIFLHSYYVFIILISRGGSSGNLKIFQSFRHVVIGKRYLCNVSNSLRFNKESQLRVFHQFIFQIVIKMKLCTFLLLMLVPLVQVVNEDDTTHLTQETKAFSY